MGLKLDRADIEPIVGNPGASWREVATYLHIWAAKIAIVGNREQGRKIKVSH
ncbi:MAG: hypothetical protein F6K48_27640 [Okeania sp. SIO3H1]|nr:hypothetical protein [Okeania sp. SIO3H1]